MKVKNLFLVSIMLVSCAQYPIPQNATQQITTPNSKTLESIKISQEFVDEKQALMEFRAFPDESHAKMADTPEGTLVYMPVVGLEDKNAVMVILLNQDQDVLDASVIYNLKIKGENFDFEVIDQTGIHRASAVRTADNTVQTTSFVTLKRFVEPLQAETGPEFIKNAAALPQCTGSVPQSLIRARDDAQNAIEMQNQVVGRAYSSYLALAAIATTVCGGAVAATVVTGGTAGWTAAACAAAIGNQIRARENWLNQSDILQDKYRLAARASNDISAWKSSYASSNKCNWY